MYVQLSKQLLDYHKEQMWTLRISEDVIFTNDHIRKYITGAQEWKLPRAPLPFHECHLKWLRSQMTAVPNDCSPKWTGLIWMLSQMNRSHMNVVSNEHGLNCLYTKQFHIAATWYNQVDFCTTKSNSHITTISSELTCLKVTFNFKFITCVFWCLLSNEDYH